MRPKFKNSERAFSEYLGRIGWQWEYEVPHGDPKPDFTILDVTGEFLAVIDVKDCQETDVDREIRQALEEKGHDCRGYDPYDHIENAIKRASGQFTGVDPKLPCMVVVADILGKPSSPTAVQGAMFGAISISFDLGRQGTAEPRVVFGKGGKMIDPPPSAGDRGPLYLEQNRRIGAVAYFKLKPVNALRAGYFADRQAIMNHYQDQLDEALEALDQSHRHYASHGISPADVEPCLEIYINPLSPVPWPSDLHGPFDQVWSLDPTSRTFQMTFNGVQEPAPRPIKKSEAQLTIEVIMGSEGWRND